MNKRMKKKLASRHWFKSYDRYRRDAIIRRFRDGESLHEGYNDTVVLITGRNLKHPHRIQRFTGCYPSNVR